MKNNKKLTEIQQHEFWIDLMENGKPINYYAKKYGVTDNEINRVYYLKLASFKRNKK